MKNSDSIRRTIRRLVTHDQPDEYTTEDDKVFDNATFIFCGLLFLALVLKMVFDL